MPGRRPAPATHRERKVRAITFFQSLSAAGFAATAIAYGPGRTGFGLFVPEFRSSFEMSTSAVGFVSSLGFMGLFLGLLIAQGLLLWRGPEAPVLLGLAAATAGMAIVAAAPSVTVLAIGVFLASSSAGFVWTPFNDAVNRKVGGADRPTALSEISTGTSVGVTLAGLAALAVVLSGLTWRIAWGAFAVAGALALVGNWASLRSVSKAADDWPRPGWRSLLQRGAVPIFTVAFVFGLVSAVYISFAADHLRAAGGVPGIPPAMVPALIFILYGIFGLAGLLTGRIKDRIGLAWLLRALMLAAALSVALLAVAPARWSGLVASAGLQGIYVMMTSAVLSFWSERLFPPIPSLSFTAVLLAYATGSVLGPALAGLAAGAFGVGAMFLGIAALPAIGALVLRAGHASEQPIAPGAAQEG